MPDRVESLLNAGNGILRLEPAWVARDFLPAGRRLGLALFVVEKRTQWDVLFAGSVIATLPMIIVFIIFQRRFIQGISVSGLKG